MELTDDWPGLINLTNGKPGLESVCVERSDDWPGLINLTNGKPGLESVCVERTDERQSGLALLT